VTEPNPAPEYQKRSRSKTPLIVAVIVVVVIAIVVAAFALGRGAQEETADDELTVGLVLEPTSLDVRTNTGVATSQILLDNVYEGLVGIRAGTVAELEPVLATDMPELSDDGLEYTFTLRDGVAFHDGAELTADDVVASLAETLVPENIGFAATPAKVDDRTVKITLDEPNNTLLWQLANFPGAIREADATNNLADSAIGTGPFAFEQWKQGDSLTLVKNDDYWGDAAKLDSVVFRFLPEGRAAVNALQEGDLDVFTALEPELRDELQGDDDFALVRADSSDVFTLGFNTAEAPLDDQRVRTALSRAIDTDALISAQNGDGKPLGSPITELEPGYRDLTDVNAFDPDSARALLAEAGQQDLSLELTVPNIYPTTVADLLKSQLADVGVTLGIRQVDFPTWLEQVYTNHDFDLSYVDHAEARDFANYANPDYYFGYDSPEVQELFAKAIAATDDAEADRLLQEAAARVAEDAPAKWLFNYTPTNVVGTQVQGFPDANTNSRINLGDVSIQR